MIDRRALISVWSSPAWPASSIAFSSLLEAFLRMEMPHVHPGRICERPTLERPSPCVCAIDNARSKARCASLWSALTIPEYQPCWASSCPVSRESGGDELQTAGDELGEGGFSQSQREGNRAGRHADRPTDVANLVVVVEGTTQTALTLARARISAARPAEPVPARNTARLFGRRRRRHPSQRARARNGRAPARVQRRRVLTPRLQASTGRACPARAAFGLVRSGAPAQRRVDRKSSP